MTDIYNNRTYLLNNPTWHEEDSFYKAKKISELLKKSALTFQTVCEVGCGTGEILVQLSLQFPSIKKFTGFDISNDVFPIAKAKQTDKVCFKLEDITNVNETFDLILVIDVIEHLENYFLFLDAISTKSKYTVFHIPLDMCMWSLFREQMLIESKNRIGHIHNFTEDFITNILEERGYRIIDKLYTEPSFKNISTKQTVINNLRKLLFRINKRFCMKTLGGYSVMLLTQNTKWNNYERKTGLEPATFSLGN